MFKRFLAVMISCMMMVSPVATFAEAGSIVPEKEVAIETEPLEEEITLRPDLCKCLIAHTYKVKHKYKKMHLVRYNGYCTCS